MKIDNFIDLLSQQEKQQFDEFCAQCEQGKFSPKAFFQFVKSVWQRLGRKDNHMRIAGPLKGNIERRYGPSQQLVQKNERDLNEIGANLPFPLGYKTLQFHHEKEQLLEGIDRPQFPLEMCATLSVILRLLSIISIQGYVDSTEGKDWGINKEIVMTLRSAADGDWLNITARLAKRYKKESSWLALVGQILDAKPEVVASIKRRDPSFKGLKIRDYLSKLINFRNKLMHGERQSAEKILEATGNLEMVLRGLEPFEQFELLVNHSGEAWQLNGRVPTKAKGPQTFPEDQVFLVAKQDGLSNLNLSPLLFFRAKFLGEQDIEFDELFFINSGSLDYLKYVGFAATEHIDGKKLGSYDQFKQYLSTIPTPVIPKNPKIDFSQFVADKTKRFVGRTDVLDEIETMVKEKSGAYICLQAYAGMGKSSIFAKLYEKHEAKNDDQEAKGDRWVFHFCMNTEGRNNALVAYRSLIAQICRALDIAEKNWLSNDIKELKDEKFPALINGELCKTKLHNLGGKRLVIVLDALDEGIGTEEESIPACFPAILQPHILVLYSYRVNKEKKNQRVESRLQHLPEEKIHQLQSANPLAGLTTEDVQLYLKKCNTGEPVPQAVFDTVWQAATQDGDGADPFYLRFVADAAESHHLSLLRSETIPQSMDDAFEQMWIRLSTENDFLIHQILLYLGIMRDHGDDELFAELFNRQRTEDKKLQPIDIAQARLGAGKLLTYDGDRYGLFHDRFRHFLVGEQKDPIAEALGLD